MPPNRGQQKRLPAAKKEQTCAKCKSHGYTVKNSGHKNHCPLRECRCVRCRKVDERREKMKRDIQIKRNKKVEEEREKQGLPNNPPAPEIGLSEYHVLIFFHLVIRD
jgi:hypothetical protein